MGVNTYIILRHPGVGIRKVPEKKSFTLRGPKICQYFNKLMIVSGVGGIFLEAFPFLNCCL